MEANRKTKEFITSDSLINTQQQLCRISIY